MADGIISIPMDTAENQDELSTECEDLMSNLIDRVIRLDESRLNCGNDEGSEVMIADVTKRKTDTIVRNIALSENIVEPLDGKSSGNPSTLEESVGEVINVNDTTNEQNNDVQFDTDKVLIDLETDVNKEMESVNEGCLTSVSKKRSPRKAIHKPLRYQETFGEDGCIIDVESMDEEAVTGQQVARTGWKRSDGSFEDSDPSGSTADWNTFVSVLDQSNSNVNSHSHSNPDHLYSLNESKSDTENPKSSKDVGTDDGTMKQYETATSPPPKKKQRRMVFGKLRSHADVNISSRCAEPFLRGWGRELVHRATLGDGASRPVADVYYFTPTSTKLRSYREVSEYLKTTNETELSLDCFTFRKVAVYHPPQEIVREAKHSRVKKPNIKEKAGIATAPKMPKKAAVASVSTISKKVEKPLKTFTAVKKVAMKEKVETVPCSLNCPGQTGILPDLHCEICLCLYHAECVGFTDDMKPFLCKKCIKERRQSGKAKRPMKENNLERRKKLKTLSTTDPEHITIDVTTEHFGTFKFIDRVSNKNGSGSAYPVGPVTKSVSSLPRLHVAPVRSTAEVEANVTDVNRPPPPLRAAPHVVRNAIKPIKILGTWTPPSTLPPKTIPLSRQPPPLKMATFNCLLGMKKAPSGVGIITRPPPPLTVRPSPIKWEDRNQNASLPISVNMSVSEHSVIASRLQTPPVGASSPADIVVCHSTPGKNGANQQPTTILTSHSSPLSTQSSADGTTVGSQVDISRNVNLLPQQPQQWHTQAIVALPSNIATLPIQMQPVTMQVASVLPQQVNQPQLAQVTASPVVSQIGNPQQSLQIITGNSVTLPQQPRQLQSIKPKFGTVTVNNSPSVLKLPNVIGTMKFVLKTSTGATTEIVVPNVKPVQSQCQPQPKFIVVDKAGHPMALMLSYGSNILELPILKQNLSGKKPTLFNLSSIIPQTMLVPPKPIAAEDNVKTGITLEGVTIPPNEASVPVPVKKETSSSMTESVIDGTTTAPVTGVATGNLFVEKLDNSENKDTLQNLDIDSSPLKMAKQRKPGVNPGLCSMQRLFAGAKTLLRVFEYLRQDDLARVCCVCHTWNWFGSQPDLWKCIKLKGICVYDWDKLASVINKHKSDRLDMRGMETFEDRNRTWHGFAASLQELGTLKHIDFDNVPVSILHTVANNLSSLECLTAEWITEYSGNNCRLDVGIFGQLKSLCKLRLRGVNGLHLPTFTMSRGFSSLESLVALTHLSITTLRDVPGPEFEFVKSLKTLKVLELGDCKHWTAETYNYLSDLSELEKLRLECGKAIDSDTLETMTSKLQNVFHLELYNFEIDEKLMATLAKFPQLKNLSLWPNSDDAPETVNTVVWKGLQQLKSLKIVAWGVLTKPRKFSSEVNRPEMESSNTGDDDDIVIIDEEKTTVGVDNITNDSKSADDDCIPISFPGDGSDDVNSAPVEYLDFVQLENRFHTLASTTCKMYLSSIENESAQSLSRINL